MSHSTPIVIAHRGASGYLPEHTLAAKALAHAMGADYLEQDVVLSRDGVPVVLHDIYLDSTSDVAARFPGRQRADGRYYAIDFSLQELRELRLHERCIVDGLANNQAVYPGRFPAQPGLFSIATLAEEIALIAGLDHSCDRKTGLYVELKAPNWHMSQNMDIAAVTLDILAQAGYDQRPEQVFVQCFDDHTLRRLRQEFATELPLIQLIAENSRGEDSEVDYDYLRTWEGTAAVAEYADGIGPHLSQVYLGRDPQGEIIVSDLVQMAHQHNLLVHPYTFRRDELPEGVQSFNDLLALFIDTLNVDGLFTDFPDTVVHYLQRGKLHK